MELKNVYIEAVRLGNNTRVELLVADKNLTVTLTPALPEETLVTLLVDSTSHVSAAGSRTHDSIEGEWIIRSSGGPLRLTFLKPRFHPGNDEGGQHLSPGTALAFQHLGHSAFINNSGRLTIIGIGSDSHQPIDDDLLQIQSVRSGVVQTLSAIEDESLTGLHVSLQGVSRYIKTVNLSIRLQITPPASQNGSRGSALPSYGC